jgi:hypothetical protein
MNHLPNDLSPSEAFSVILSLILIELEVQSLMAKSKSMTMTIDFDLYFTLSFYASRFHHLRRFRYRVSTIDGEYYFRRI